MTDAAETVVYRWLAAGDAGDLDAFDQLLHPDALIHAPLGLSTMASGFAGVVGTGRGFRIDQAVITHLGDGKVAEAWEIADIATLREQVSAG